MHSFVDLAIVTGAGRGLGRAVAERLGAIGVPVLCIARTERAAATAAAIRAAGGEAEALVQDLADAAGAERAVAGWLGGRSAARIAVVLAAGTLGTPGGLIESAAADWGGAYAVNVLGNLSVLRAALPRMLEARFGRVVALAGGGAAYAYPRFSAYALSKTAMVRAVENLHAELEGRGDFQVVCLAPGALETDMLAQVRAAGAEVRTTVPLDEPVAFVERFVTAAATGLSGRFVHVRDPWQERLAAGTDVPGDLWLLRRIEK